MSCSPWFLEPRIWGVKIRVGNCLKGHSAARIPLRQHWMPRWLQYEQRPCSGRMTINGIRCVNIFWAASTIIGFLLLGQSILGAKWWGCIMRRPLKFHKRQNWLPYPRFDCSDLLWVAFYISSARVKNHTKKVGLAVLPGSLLFLHVMSLSLQRELRRQPTNSWDQ